MVVDIWRFPEIVVPPNHPFIDGISLINHPFCGTPIFGTPLMVDISILRGVY